MCKKILFAAVVLWAIAVSAYAQQTVLTVPEILKLVAERNAEVKTAKSGHQASLQGVSVAKSARLPQITAELDLNYLGDGTILDRDFSNAMRDKLPHFGNTLAVNAYQPIYQGGAINAGIEMAKLASELSAIGIDQAIDSKGIEAISNCFNLLKMRNLRNVYAENISITERLIQQMTEHYHQGTALRNDITRYELRLSSLRYDLQTINNSISILNQNITSLLDLEPSTEIVPDMELNPDDLNIKSEEYWQSLAQANSNELKAVDKTRAMTQVEMKIDRAQRLPSIGVVVGDALSGPVTFEIPAINKNYNVWFAGVALKYNFSSLYTSNKKIKQKALELNRIRDQREAIGNALERRVHESYTLAQQAREMLNTETVNVKLAAQNYEVVETRFQNDMALLTDMLDASTSKLDAETRLVNARVSLLLSLYQLKFVSGTLTLED